MNEAQLKALIVLLGVGAFTFWLGYRTGISQMREAYGDVVSYEALAYLAIKDGESD